MMKKTQVEIRKDIAGRLKLARQSAGFSSLQDFCEQHNVELTQYQKHEDGELSMIASEIKQYCIALKISVAYLMLGEEPEKLKR